MDLEVRDLDLFSSGFLEVGERGEVWECRLLVFCSGDLTWFFSVGVFQEWEGIRIYMSRYGGRA